MARLKSEQVQREAAHMTASIMASSARTAPKTRGVDAIETLIIDGDDLEALASAMEREAEQKPEYLAPTFARDATGVRNSLCVLLVGVKGDPKKVERPFDCGGCGYHTCQQLASARQRQTQGKAGDFDGPNCIFQVMDLGIALASAAKVAGDLNVDNRLMYTIGVAAKKQGWLDSDIMIGIPLSVAGKNPYFDR